MRKNEKSGRSCRDSSGSVLNQKSKMSERTVGKGQPITRDKVREITDRVIRDHRPALEWLGDK